MEILYFGFANDDKINQEIISKENPFNVAQQSFERAIIKEFKKKNDFSLDLVSIFQTAYYPNEQLFINKNFSGANFKYVSYINIPFLKEISFFMNTCVLISKWYLKNRDSEGLTLFFAAHYAPVSLGIVLMGNMLRINKVVTFPDLPLFIFSKERIKKMLFYKKIVIKPYLAMIKKLQKSYDGYLLFSEEMNKVVNPYHKHYQVFEGTFNKSSLNLDKRNNIHSGVITYAGTLNREVGIDTIIEVFNLLEYDQKELWFMGTGDMVDEIEKLARLDERVKYFGFLPKSQVFEKLKQSSLLVNLRDKDDEYTRFSFPSKMFEYMASGTPVFTTKLLGIPPEYYNHVYSIDSNNVKEIALEIDKILALDEKENYQFGKKSQEFVLNKKNSSEQVKKIIQLLIEVKN